MWRGHEQDRRLGRCIRLSSCFEFTFMKCPRCLCWEQHSNNRLSFGQTPRETSQPASLGRSSIPHETLVHGCFDFLSFMSSPLSSFSLLLICLSHSPLQSPTPPLPAITCYRGENNADITLIMQFHQVGAGRAAVFSQHCETMGH